MADLLDKEKGTPMVWFLRFGVVLLLSLGIVKAQSTQVFPLGTTTANAVENGLGFNVNTQQPWQIAAANAAGASWGRMQCSWSQVEQQTDPPGNAAASPRFVQNTPCAQTYQAASTINPRFHWSVVAGYSPPSHRILSVQLTTDGHMGDTALHVVVVSTVGGATLARVKPVLDHIHDFTTLHAAPNYGMISNKHSGAGDIITSVTRLDATHATIYLGSALKAAIPTTDTLEIMEDLYPAIADDSPTNPSAVAYGDYATFLAQDMASRGVSGYIELWNEPPWAPDPWDAIQAEYDYVVSGSYKPANLYGINSVVFESASSQTPFISLVANNQGNDPASSPSDWSATIPSNAFVHPKSPFPTWGLIANVMTRTWPAGVRATANSGSGNGTSTPLSPAFPKATGVAFTQPSLTVTNESFHPYCGPHCNPEELVASSACIKAASLATSSPANNPYAGATCFVPGTAHKGNLLSYFLENEQQKNLKSNYGLAADLTETNVFDSEYAGELMQDGKGDLRHFLGFEANGVNPIIFYELCSGIGTGGPAARGSFTAIANGTNTLELTTAPGYALAYRSSNNTFTLTNQATGTYFVLEGGNLEFVIGTNVPANTAITATRYASGVYTLTLNQPVPSGTTAFTISSWDPTIGFVTTPSGGCYFSPYRDTRAYPLHAEVTESSTDSTPYVSLQANNVGHDPATSPGWWSSKGIYSPTPALTMLAAVISDLAPISNLPVLGYASSTLPSVASYAGTYPLSTVYMVGARPNAASNSVAMYIYQLSECTSAPHCWSTLSAPPGATATISLLPGTRITSAINTVTRKAVPYALSGQQVAFTGTVSDEPIEIIVDPSAARQRTEK